MEFRNKNHIKETRQASRETIIFDVSDSSRKGNETSAKASAPQVSDSTRTLAERALAKYERTAQIKSSLWHLNLLSKNFDVEGNPIGK